MEEQPPAYLPQEDWAHACPTRKTPQAQEGRGSDCSSLGCYRECQLSEIPGNMQSPGPSLSWPVAFSAASRAWCPTKKMPVREAQLEAWLWEGILLPPVQNRECASPESHRILTQSAASCPLWGNGLMPLELTDPWLGLGLMRRGAYAIVRGPGWRQEVPVLNPCGERYPLLAS